MSLIGVWVQPFTLQTGHYGIISTEKEEVEMDVMETIRGRRSIRKYKTDPIADDVLHTLLEAIRWAPSWANTQCWEVILVKDAKTRSDVTTAFPRGNPALSAIVDAPLLLVLCGKKGLSGYYKGQVATSKGDWLMFDTGIAMQNLCLAAHSLGLGTVVVGLFDHKKVEEILGVPSGTEVVAMTPVGYPAAEGGTPKRKEISEFVFYEKYGKK
jgi:nitroreductase